MMFGIDARRRHRNQTTLVEKPAAIDHQIAHAPLRGIDNHTIESADSHTRLRPDVDGVNERRFEPATLEEAKTWHFVAGIHAKREEQSARHRRFVRLTVFGPKSGGLARPCACAVRYGARRFRPTPKLAIRRHTPIGRVMAPMSRTVKSVRLIPESSVHATDQRTAR